MKILIVFHPRDRLARGWKCYLTLVFHYSRFVITWTLGDTLPTFLQTSCFVSCAAVPLCVPFVIWRNIHAWARLCAMGKVSDVLICDVIMHWMPFIIAWSTFQRSPATSAFLVNLVVATLYLYFVDWRPAVWYGPSGLSDRCLVIGFTLLVVGVHFWVYVQHSFSS